ncbi:MAG: lactococcin 972 family bacteriocin [Breznakia sp.]
MGTVYSYYYHPKKTHRASVQGAYYVNSGWTYQKKWAVATAKRRLFCVDYAYYDVK